MSLFHSLATPLVIINFANSSHVEEIQDSTPNSVEAKTLSTPSMSNIVESKDDEAIRTQNTMQTDGGDSIEEPKLGMLFRSKEVLVSYYKKYEKQCGFEIMMQRIKRDGHRSLIYVMLDCAHGGKAQNCTSNVVRPRLTSKTNYKAKINATLVDGMLKALTVHNTQPRSIPTKIEVFSLQYRSERVSEASVRYK